MSCTGWLFLRMQHKLAVTVHRTVVFRTGLQDISSTTACPCLKLSSWWPTYIYDLPVVVNYLLHVYAATPVWTPCFFSYLTNSLEFTVTVSWFARSIYLLSIYAEVQNTVIHQTFRSVSALEVLTLSCPTNRHLLTYQLTIKSDLFCIMAIKFRFRHHFNCDFSRDSTGIWADCSYKSDHI